MNQLTLREATTADSELINSLASMVFPHTYKDLLSPEQLDYMMEWMYNPAHIERQIMEEGHCYFIAYCDDEPCGYLAIQQEGETLFHLQKIYVLPRFQGKGVGLYLFEQAIGYIKRVHPEPCAMELNVNRSNKAVHFYERMGMKKVREGDFCIGNGYYMNDFIMGLEL